MSETIVKPTDKNRQTWPDVPPISLHEMKEAADLHFKAKYTICHFSHHYPLVAGTGDMTNAYSPVTTWLYVGRDESGGHYIAKKYSGGRVPDVEVMKELRAVVMRRREG